MKSSFITKTMQDGNNKVIVYGINKVFCSRCTIQLQHLQTVYACQHATVFTDKPEFEYRDIHCYNCMHTPNFYCDKASVNHNYGQHIDMKAKLHICPMDIDIKDYLESLTVVN